MRFERITIDPSVETGKACIRDLRFPVSRLLGLLASGETKESILKPYPGGGRYRRGLAVCGVPFGRRDD
jgi:uncharacterized protein (DUF433 family)